MTVTQPPSTEASKPDTPQPGIFLPSMIWTTDQEVVETEKKRLLALHQQLNALVSDTMTSDETATWRMMAEESLWQLDRDIDSLFDWLQATEHGERRERPDREYD